MPMTLPSRYHKISLLLQRPFIRIGESRWGNGPVTPKAWPRVKNGQSTVKSLLQVRSSFTVLCSFLTRGHAFGVYGPLPYSNHTITVPRVRRYLTVPRVRRYLTVPRVRRYLTVPISVRRFY
jgi:hypothetical protein